MRTWAREKRVNHRQAAWFTSHAEKVCTAEGSSAILAGDLSTALCASHPDLLRNGERSCQERALIRHPD